MTKTRQIIILDEGINCYVDPFHYAAKHVETVVKRKYRHTTKYHYVRFSRGGGLAQIMALHHFRKGISRVCTPALWVSMPPTPLQNGRSILLNII